MEIRVKTQIQRCPSNISGQTGMYIENAKIPKSISVHSFDSPLGLAPGLSHCRRRLLCLIEIAVKPSVSSSSPEGPSDRATRVGALYWSHGDASMAEPRRLRGAGRCHRLAAPMESRDARPSPHVELARPEARGTADRAALPSA